MREEDILYETPSGSFWVAKQSNWFAVYKNGLTHSTRVASIGQGAGPTLGIERAITEANRRDELENQS